MLKFIENLRGKTYAQILTIYLRYLVGSAFVIAAIAQGKLSSFQMPITGPGKPIGELEPLAQFFRVLSESGIYWKFIGWTQMLVGLLLLTQRYARIGALIFFIVMLNIFIITVSYDFRGTPYITGPMLLASLYLLVWDYRTLLPIIDSFKFPAATPIPIVNHYYWLCLGVVMYLSLVLLGIFKTHMALQLGVPFIEGFLGFIIFFLLFRKPATSI